MFVKIVRKQDITQSIQVSEVEIAVVKVYLGV